MQEGVIFGFSAPKLFFVRFPSNSRGSCNLLIQRPHRCYWMGFRAVGIEFRAVVVGAQSSTSRNPGNIGIIRKNWWRRVQVGALRCIGNGRGSWEGCWSLPGWRSEYPPRRKRSTHWNFNNTANLLGLP